MGSSGAERAHEQDLVGMGPALYISTHMPYSYLGQEQLSHIIHSAQDTCSPTTRADKQE